jgi:uncharacterized protein
VEAGVEAILGTLRGEDVIPAEAPRGGATDSLKDVAWPMRLAFGAMFLVVVGTFSIAALFGKGSSGWFLYLFLIPFYATFPMVFAGPILGVMILGMWIVVFPILKLLLSLTPWGKSFVASHPDLVRFASSRSSRGSGWSSGGWSSGGSSGWSGGGGSFGGGGASSSW